MKKFIVLYHAPASMMKQATKVTPAQAKAGMDGWMKWAEKAGKALVEMGAPLGDSGWIKGTPGAGHLGGYSMVQSDSMDSAKKADGGMDSSAKAAPKESTKDAIKAGLGGLLKKKKGN